MKNLFIMTMLSMVDNETVFQGSWHFWGAIFDKLESGVTEGIDQTFVTVYKALKAADMVQHSLQFKRQNQLQQEQRILLSAIDQRLHGKYVYVICENNQMVRVAESAFFKLVDSFKPLLVERGLNIDLLAKGAIKFISLQGSAGQQFDWNAMRLYGMDQKDIVYVMPSVVDGHYKPLLEAYQRHLKNIEASDFVKLLEIELERDFPSRKKSEAFQGLKEKIQAGELKIG